MNESELLPAQTLPICSPSVPGEMSMSHSGLFSLIYSNHLMSLDYRSGDCFNPKWNTCSSYLKECNSSTSPPIGLAVFNI